MRKPFVIGLAGPAGVGKTSTARAIRALRPRAVIDSTGAPIHAMLRAFYQAAGLEPRAIEARVTGDLKRAPCRYLEGRTPTEAMQTLGTEWGRENIGGALWASRWTDRAVRHLADWRPIINDSVRFDDEVEAIRSRGGVVIRLEGRGDDVGAHASEAGVAADLVMAVDAAPEVIARRILDAVEARGDAPAATPAFDPARAETPAA